MNKAGLLDTRENSLTLREQEWEIAKTLAEVSRWERERAAAPSPAQSLGEAQAGESAALDETLTSITGRVEALEAYARHVAEADLVHRAHEQIHAIVLRSVRYHDLLARTARDALAVEQIHRLDEHAQALKQVLAQRLADPAATGSGPG
ncbi:hypothetical protein AB0L05_10295 [Nonomuraea pusilla]|uniref:hypothetical protein n=1 Tax=Nonomuraea pusilla TaxID=46177 RepID=UPI0033289EEF